MKTVDLASWNDFPAAIANVRTEYGSREVVLPEDRSITLQNDVLFRGQADSTWSLETTLERTSPDPYSIQHYLQRADSVVNEIESLTGVDWKLPAYPDIIKAIEIVQDSMRTHLPGYEYLVYLRHHGFPSPLLDWTRSPYVAAFFALENRTTAERACVYAFIETPEGGKSFREGDATIHAVGQYITTHIRHYTQKANYTIATRWDRDQKKHFFCSHHDSSPPVVGSQNVLVKITFPGTDRIKALKELDDYNINQYTLYQSEDALVRSLGMRAFELESE